MNIPSDERVEQLEQLKRAVGPSVKAPLWACVQVCDISKLEELTRAASTLPQYFDLLPDTCLSMPLRWMQRAPRDTRSGQSTPSSTPSTPSTPSRSRPSKPKKLAKHRDKERCVLTKASVCEAAHIFPHSMIDPSKRPTNLDSAIPPFWKMLEFFFEQERLEAWRRELFKDPEDPTKLSDGCHNQLCLNSFAHDLWTMGMFALRPVELRPDHTAITVEFHWQQRPSHGRFDSVDLSARPGSSLNLSNVNGNRLFDENGTMIHSGMRFTFTTENPVTHPLPSFELLSMQWHLNRIVSMSGAAGLYDEVQDEEDDDGWVDGFEEERARENPFDVPRVPRPPSTCSSISSLNDYSLTTASTDPSPAKSSQVQNVLSVQGLHIDDAAESIHG
jgi:hypothetical protein